MRDEKDEILDDLFRKARLMKPYTDSVEEHFETRLLAAMEERGRDQTLWSVWTWRLVPWFAVIVIIVGIGNFTIDPDRSSDLSAIFSSGDDDYQVTSMLAGG